MYNAFNLSKVENNNFLIKNGNKLSYLYGLNKLNIFVGENNSSKSRMLRLLMSSKTITGFCNVISESYEANIQNCKSLINSKLKSFSFGTDYSKMIINDNGDFINFYCSVSELIRSNIINPLTSNDQQKLDQIRSYLNSMFKYIEGSKDKYIYDLSKAKRVYIPTLRGVEKFSNYFASEDFNKAIGTISMNGTQRGYLSSYINNSDSIYKNKVSSVYGIEPGTIFTGENLFDDLTTRLLGQESERKIIYEFQEFISKNFYDGKKFEITPQIKTKVINVKIDNIEHELHNMGDGIKQMITILYPIFVRKEAEYLFFIEEPEINLHPGYQRKLIEILMSDIFSKHQFFITTHSNHIVDSCFDYNRISLYKFINNRNDTFKVVNTSSKDIDILNLLGVNNTSVFLANCTIWVEGISDKILIKKYLDVYLGDNNKFQEDIDYSFVEYGGNNITHWSFDDTNDIDKINASGITNKAFIIVDNDNNTKQERKEKLKEIFKDNYYGLSVREIENTISKTVLDKTFIDKDHPIKKAFTEKKYQNERTYMGDFIDKHYNCRKKWSNKDKDGKGTGTINNKLEFSKLIANNIESRDDLSTEAIELCRKIEEFIKS